MGCPANAQFWRPSTLGRFCHEVERRWSSSSRDWRRTSPEAHLSDVLARICCITDNDWSRFSHFSAVLVRRDGHCFVAVGRRDCVSSARTPGLRPCRHRRRRGSCMLISKFHFDSTAATYAGLGLLIAASLWNSWPQRSVKPCPQCAPTGRELIELSAKRR
jgi:hypothetical protein